MNKLIEAANNSIILAKEKAPLLLTMASIGLGAGATYMAVKVTPEAHDIYTCIMSDTESTYKEKQIGVIKNVVPLYGPAILTGSAAAAAGIASYAISKHRLDVAYDKIAGLSTAYILANDGLKQYKKEVVKKFGENAEEEIQKNVSEEQAKKYPIKKDIIIANDGPEEIMQDSISGQYFKGTREDIYLICNELQKRLQVEDAIPASEYFYEADIDACNLGDCVGWVCGDEPWPRFTDFLLPDGRKAVRVEIDTSTQFLNYRRLY